MLIYDIKFCKLPTWLTVLDCPAFCRKPMAGAKLGRPREKYVSIV
jgi:hypothetical protein